MNIIQQQDALKSLPDQMLQKELLTPTGAAPSYLVLTELQRRKDMRASFSAMQQEPGVSMAEEFSKGLGSAQAGAYPEAMRGAMPQDPAGGAGPQEAPPPQGPSPMGEEGPQAFASGGAISSSGSNGTNSGNTSSAFPISYGTTSPTTSATQFAPATQGSSTSSSEPDQGYFYKLIMGEGYADGGEVGGYSPAPSLNYVDRIKELARIRRAKEMEGPYSLPYVPTFRERFRSAMDVPSRDLGTMGVDAIKNFKVPDSVKEYGQNLSDTTGEAMNDIIAKNSGYIFDRVRRGAGTPYANLPRDSRTGGIADTPYSFAKDQTDPAYGGGVVGERPASSIAGGLGDFGPNDAPDGVSPGNLIDESYFLNATNRGQTDGGQPRGPTGGSVNTTVGGGSGRTGSGGGGGGGLGAALATGRGSGLQAYMDQVRSIQAPDRFGEMEKRNDEDRQDMKGMRDENKGMALLQAGLSIAGGTSPHAAVNIGQGGMAGVKYWQDASKEMRMAERDLRTAENSITIARANRDEKQLETGLRLYEKAEERAQRAADRANSAGISASDRAERRDQTRMQMEENSKDRSERREQSQITQVADLYKSATREADVLEAKAAQALDPTVSSGMKAQADALRKDAQDYYEHYRALSNIRGERKGQPALPDRRGGAPPPPPGFKIVQ